MRPELVAGSGGVFDVLVDGELVFSKHREWRFPTEEEVLQRIRAAAGTGS